MLCKGLLWGVAERKFFGCVGACERVTAVIVTTTGVPGSDVLVAGTTQFIVFQNAEFVLAIACCLGLTRIARGRRIAAFGLAINTAPTFIGTGIFVVTCIIVILAPDEDNGRQNGGADAHKDLGHVDKRVCLQNVVGKVKRT